MTLTLVKVFRFLYCFLVMITSPANAGDIFTTTNTMPSMRLVFYTHGDENIEVRDFFVEFASKEGLRVEDVTAKMPFKDSRPVFNLALFRDDTAIVKVINIINANQFFVGLYLSSFDPAFARISLRLTASLKEKWPDTTPYDGP